MRTRSAPSYNPRTKWKGTRGNNHEDASTIGRVKNRPKSDETASTKRQNDKNPKILKSNNDDASTAEDYNNDNILVNIHSDGDKKLDFDDKYSDDVKDNDVLAQGDKFVVNGELMTNPIVTNINEITAGEIYCKSKNLKSDANKDLESSSSTLYERSTFPRQVTAKISTRTRSMNAKQLVISMTVVSSMFSYQKTVTMDQSIKNENYDEEFSGLLDESMNVSEPKLDLSIDLTQSESETNATQDADQSDDCIILSQDNNKDDQRREDQPQDWIENNDDSQLEKDLDTYPEDLPSPVINNRSMTITSTAETTYHTTTQSLLSVPDSTLLDDLSTKIENYEQDHFNSSDIREPTPTDIVDDQFRKSYLSNDFDVLSKIEPKSRTVQTTVVKKRSVGTQTSEAETEAGVQTNIEKEKFSTGVQTDDVDPIRTWKYRCPTCSIYLDTAEEYRLHVAKYSSYEGCRRRREMLTPASSYMRRNYRRSGSFEIDNASFFTTDNEDKNASSGKLDALEKISANAKKSDESVDKSLMRSLLNVSDSVVAKDLSECNSDVSKNSRWSARFYDGTSALISEDEIENVNSSTTSTDAFTNSTLSSITRPSIHNTIEEEQLCHFYDDNSARNLLLDFDSSHLSTVSQEFYSELRSFVLEPQPGLKRNGRPVKNIRKHLKYFPPPIHQSSTRNSPQSTDDPNGGDSFLSSNEAEGDVAIYQFSSSESEEMEKSALRHQRSKFMYSSMDAKTTNNVPSGYKATQSASSRPDTTLNEQSSFYTSTTARMSSCQRAALNQLNGAISALDSLISDGRAFERRFESFERSARGRMQNEESEGAVVVQLASPKALPHNPDREMLSPLRGGIFKLKSLIVKFENITAKSDLSVPPVLPTSNAKPKTAGKSIHEEEKKVTVEVAVGPDVAKEEEADKENRRQSTEIKRIETPKPANKTVALSRKKPTVSSAATSSSLKSPTSSSAKKNITIKRGSRNVIMGRNRRSGLVTPVRRSATSWDDEEDNDDDKKYATTPRTTREVLAHLKVRNPLDDLSDDDESANAGDDSSELIESIIRSRNAFTPLPGPTATCRVCGLQLASQEARNHHYVRYHIDELAKCVDAVGIKSDDDVYVTPSSVERRVNSVDSGNVSGRGHTSTNPIYEEEEENEEMFFLVESGDGSRLDFKTPLPTLDEMKAIKSSDLPRRCSSSNRSFQSLGFTDDPNTSDIDGEKISSRIASAVSGDVFSANMPSSSGDSSKSSWMRWANLEDGSGPILNVSRYKTFFNQSAKEGVRQISFQSFSSQNDSLMSLQNVSGNDTVFTDNHSEPCEGTSSTSSIQYRACSGLVGNSPDSPTLDRMQSSAADERLPIVLPAEGTLLVRMTPPRFVTPDNQPSISTVNNACSSVDASLAVTPMTSSTGKSPLDAMFDISARVERFNRGTPLPSSADGVEEIDEHEKKQRRRTGYNAKTTPSVQEMVELIHNNASTSKLSVGRQKCDDYDFGTPLAHRIALTGRPAKAFNLWRANTGERICVDDSVGNTAVNQDARRLAALADELPPPDGWQFVMSFESAFRALDAARQAETTTAVTLN